MTRSGRRVTPLDSCPEETAKESVSTIDFYCLTREAVYLFNPKNLMSKPMRHQVIERTCHPTAYHLRIGLEPCTIPFSQPECSSALLPWNSGYHLISSVEQARKKTPRFDCGRLKGNGPSRPPRPPARRVLISCAA
ncbi:hypothetical protein BO70DRAFT_432911 [Aspergillus heteromorphus CBS 117.55]|uniref:Uncharacterized protein n=1 Tax=Aspergillus heteromorphus CBS 117.55 TaxID=1448321 RepID=A0A317V0C6_9EURO|nr:uncharacterized protein BO70DRAFT_432911 [Aspergillus heteromorphus CBS 117.55]PWY67515.1 hypothetical protein BO70DRAFT_432911 [Aspergillus heteromorphus CBS 117.55]